jgi:hypothetical protein
MPCMPMCGLEMLLNENGGVDQVQMRQRDDRPSERSAKVESVQFAVSLVRQRSSWNGSTG